MVRLRQLNWLWIVRIASAAVLAYSLYMCVSIIKERSANAKAYEDTRKLYEQDVLAAEQSARPSSPADEQSLVIHDVLEAPSIVPATDLLTDVPHNDTSEPDNRFANLKESNKDFIGWIRIEGTNIDYPVVQTTDNDYYLDHNFNRSKNRGGAIFMDYRNERNPPSRNTIIYGHHMKDGTMFTDLIKYTKQEFYDENPLVTIEMMDGEETTWEIFSAYSTSVDFNYIIPDFDSNKAYIQFIHSIIRKSWIKTDVKLSANDQILTLSTCSYDFKDGRMVVHARKIQ